MITLKKLIFILAVFAILFSVGCFAVPEEPVVPVESPIVCAGGHYQVFYYEWTLTGCPGDEQVAGTYWENLDGRMFLLGEPVEWNPNGIMQADIIAVYGECPTSYIKEIFPQ